MSTLFARLFKRTPASADGLTQPQREAIVDLLNFCTYADDRLTLAEDRIVADEVAQFNWEPAVAFETFAARSITRVRDALESPARRASFLADVAKRLANTEVQTRALGVCKDLFRADGEFSPDETVVFHEIEHAFGWPPSGRN